MRQIDGVWYEEVLPNVWEPVTEAVQTETVNLVVNQTPQTATTQQVRRIGIRSRSAGTAMHHRSGGTAIR